MTATDPIPKATTELKAAIEQAFTIAVILALPEGTAHAGHAVS